MYWALRRKELCEVALCPDAPDGGQCDSCPQVKLDAAQATASGSLLKRALDTKAALKLGVHVTLGDIPADEFYAMLILEEENDRYEQEKNHHGG